MKLLRFGPINQEKPGLLDDQGNIRDLSELIHDLTPDTITQESLNQIAEYDPSRLPLVDHSTRIGPCVKNVGKVLAIGLNYSDHATETGKSIPVEPLVFSKAVNCLSGPNDPLILPKDSKCTDYEIELAVIIGSRAKYVDKKEALNYVAGFAVMNDYSEREFQIERGGQWIKGKSFDGFGPLGPWLVTKDEIPDPQKFY